jgi:serine/threonine-protein kinase
MKWTWRKIGVLALASIVVITILGAVIDKLVLPFVVSMTDTVHVPAIVGRDRASAEVLLRDAGLVVMEPREQFSATVAAGTVMSQLPYAGATVKEGRRIYITVSKGVETLSMPSLYGATMRDARLRLMRLGLQTGDMSYDTSGSVPAGRILRQSVPAGSSVASGTTVNLVISRGTTMVRVPLLVSLKLDEAEQLLRDVGLVPGAMTVIPSSAFQAGTIMHQDPAADSLVVVGSTVTFVTAK